MNERGIEVKISTRNLVIHNVWGIRLVCTAGRGYTDGACNLELKSLGRGVTSNAKMHHVGCWVFDVF